MAETARPMTDLAELLAEARRVVERFRNAPAETQRDHSEVYVLVQSFRALEKNRKKLQKQPELRDLCLSVSKAMLSLNEALRLRSDVEPSNHFVDLYHFLVVVEPDPELLKDETTREAFKKAMIEARKVGLRLCEDSPFRAGLEEVPHKKKHFFERLAKVCRAHERFACLNAVELPAILADASRFEAIAEPAQQETHAKAAEARQAFLEIECSLASTPANVEECLQSASRLAGLFESGSKQLRFAVRNDVINAFKLIQKERSGPDLVCGAGLQLSRAMLFLNEALRSRAKGESGLVGRFDDLYEFHECVRFDDELFADTQIRSDLQASVREAYQIGLEILGDSKTRQRLDQNPNKKGEFLSRLGEICRAHAVYECVAPSDLSAILQSGIEFFQASLKVHPEPEGKHLDFNCPRTAECQMRLGCYADAIQTLMAISNSGNGIKPKTAWEARSHRAECCQSLGQKARLAGEDEAAQAHFQNAENWYIAAAHIWEPDLDPRYEVCRSEQNRTLQGQMAWLYLDWGDPVKAETLARMFLACVEPADENAQHTSYFLLTSSHLGTALLRQKNRNAEAIQVFEQLLAHDLPPVHRLRPLIALRQL